MKNTLLILSALFLFHPNNLQGQGFMINFEDTSSLKHLKIDTFSNPNCLWQIAIPQKNILNYPRSSPYVIITDSVNSYPVNNISSFTVKIVAGVAFSSPTPALNYTAGLYGHYSVNSDSINDFGKIEFSPDNGITWVELTDTNVIPPSGWNSDRPILTGNSSGWKYFGIKTLGFAGSLGVQQGDTMQYKFTFISDSSFDNLDGLMFDDLVFDDFAESVSNIQYEQFRTKAFPNPATQTINLEFENRDLTSYELVIFDELGRLIHKQANITQNHVQINTDKFITGIYQFKLVNRKKSKLSTGRIFIANKP